MENHHFHNHFPLKVLSRRLFPSSLTSCQYQTLTDHVAEPNSINPITKPKKKFHQTDNNNSPKQAAALLKNYYKFSDVQEDDNNEFFSSSSSSGDCVRPKKKNSAGQPLAKYEISSGKIRRNIKKKKSTFSAVIEENYYAVEKNSTDPYGDFLTSMVEMIVEKQIIDARDLEQLLICFLSLNQVSCHGIIFDVFVDVCRTLFTN